MNRPSPSSSVIAWVVAVLLILVVGGWIFTNVSPGPNVAGALHWIILLPLIGAAVNRLLGRALGRANVNLIACGMVLAAFAISFMGLLAVRDTTATLRDELWSWFTVGTMPVAMAFSMDRLTAVLMCVVTGVGFLIHVYSTEYMGHDEGYARYFAYLNLFIAMMATLVLGANLVVMFVGWEGVGLASYLLIGFWFTDDQKAYAGRKAFVVNRIGDFGFLLGIFTLIALFGTVDFEGLRLASVHILPATQLSGAVLGHFTSVTAVTLACLLLFVGAVGKSAQLPLYVWLPDAMAGPTPVSALIHAATMVTAGVYMVARLSFLYVFSPTAMAVVACIGAATALVAALMAFAQNDIKKVLAYSTISQLGYMFIAVGVGAFWAGIYHLVTHAFFKACLFLGAGSVMHGMEDETDIRKFGGLKHEMWHTWATFGIATVTITGVLPLSGFFSKDDLLHAALDEADPWFTWVPGVVYGIGLLAALCTAFYMWRMFELTFDGKRRGLLDHHAHESGPAMVGPLWVLAGLSVGALVWGLPGADGTTSFERFLAPVFGAEEAGRERMLRAWSESAHAAMPEAVVNFSWSAMLPGYIGAWLIALFGFAIATWMYLGAGQAVPGRIATGAPRLYAAFANKFYVDEFYDRVIVRPLRFLSFVLWRVVDAIAIDKILVEGPAMVTGWVAQVARYFQNGNVQRYAAVMAISAVVLFWVFLS